MTVAADWEVTVLETPAIPRLVPPEIFDAFGWTRSTSLVWRHAPSSSRSLDRHPEVTSDNPPGMVFLLDAGCTFLPRELAALHVPRLVDPGDATTFALAPYAIDDATDLLYENRVDPRSVLQLATSSVAGLFWGLHDWAHFHNHGEFREEQKALTELQCDSAALAWIFGNRVKVGIGDAEWRELRGEVAEIGRGRFIEVPAADGVNLVGIWAGVDRFLDRAARDGS